MSAIDDLSNEYDMQRMMYQTSEQPAGTLNDWGSWSRDIAGSVITGALDLYKYRTISGAGGIPAVGVDGRVYTEGRRAESPKGLSVNAAGLNISGTWLIVGAAIVGYLLLKK